MVNVVRYSKENMNEWNSFLRLSKTPLFMFDRNYMDYHSDRFKDHSLMLYNKNKLVAIVPCSEHDGTLRSHGGLTYGGMVTDRKMRQTIMMECFEALKDYCESQQLNSILYKSIPHIYHKQPSEEDIYALFYYGAQIVKVEASTVIKLKDPIKMSELRRRQIKRAIKHGVKIEVDDSKTAYSEFMRIQDEILVERHRVNAVHTGEEIFLLHTKFPNSIHLYAAKKNDKIIGGAIVYVYEDVVHTQYLCADEEARNIGALDATIDRIISDYKSSRKWLDFGISTEKMGRFLNEGLVNQKEGFGGRTIVYSSWALKYKEP